MEALGAGPLAAPIFQPKAKAILEGSYAGQFPVALMFKDLNLVLDAAGRSRIPLPQAAATRECFASAMARGLGEEDIAAVIKVLESLTSKTVSVITSYSIHYTKLYDYQVSLTKSAGDFGDFTFAVV